MHLLIECKEQLLIAFDYFKITNNEYLLNTAKYNIADIKKYIGDYEEAREIYIETAYFFRNHQEKIRDTDYKLYYIYSLISLISTNTRLENFAENKKLIAEGLHAISKQKVLAEYKGYFISSEGTDAYFQKKYPLAISKLNEALALYQDQWKHLTEKFYIGMSYVKINEPEKAFPYFKIIEKEYDETQKIDPEFRPAIEFFVDYYKSKGDKAQELFYINKLLAIDINHKSNNKTIASEIKKNYDVRNLLQAKTKIEKERIFERYAILGTLGILLTSLFFMIKSRKSRQQKPSLLEVTIPEKEFDIKENDLEIDEANGISLENNWIEKLNEETKNTIDYERYKPINKTTVGILLRHLETFEQKEGFTEHNLRLYDLAKKFNTNEKYLSKIILISRGKSFNDYITHLRLDYYVKKFQDKSSFKTITDLSQQSGFENYQFFSKEFKNRYRVNPTEYA
ncbi:AraC family transcriptional regulator [Kaistella flava (ex Peng et al. 2021)]|uniref:AraC family transcriptional regulator n=1 Tax=Kaistella flava (ex Peng et al. 2021) TaxID=2038776 RepID=A0A7M2YA50_9FLAO|nr:helix-turn-helix domain-containing protein [Kaistella flava (ex Peng et al. 2021)]QOW10689.1 AraC family transcriptional regulator [Kaistella flava (ex Peng et al. 2021)]